MNYLENGRRTRVVMIFENMCNLEKGNFFKFDEATRNHILRHFSMIKCIDILSNLEPKPTKLFINGKEEIIDMVDLYRPLVNFCFQKYKDNPKLNEEIELVDIKLNYYDVVTIMKINEEALSKR